jgi:hypothetical protein
MPLTKITTGALSDANITSPKLANSIAVNDITLKKVNETSNITVSSASGNVNVDISNNSVHFFTGFSTANTTFNLRGNSSATFDSVTNTGQAVSVAIAVRNDTERFVANLSIDDVLQTVYYAGNTRPQPAIISSEEINLYSYSIFKIAGNNYTIIAGNTLFGLT